MTSTQCEERPFSANPKTKNVSPKPRYVIISGYHDYRSRRRANLHFIADELKKRGETMFFSLRYSLLSRYREDPRHGLSGRANQFETVDDVQCYLWQTLLHPFNLPKGLDMIERASFALFARRLPRGMQAALSSAEFIFVESGIGITFVPLIKRVAPQANIIYMASDSLDAINQAQSIKQAFAQSASLFESARVPSPYLRADVPASITCYYIPHGIDKKEFEAIGPSPFVPASRNAVSVGSMLFDPTFFEIAGRLFPEINFHVIGSGHINLSRDNVIYYEEMPFKNTLPYLKHCSFAIAPYQVGVEPYLTHTSMKLMQYGYLGLPSVCPAAVCGGFKNRFAYNPGDEKSIYKAVESALDAKSFKMEHNFGWDEITSRLLSPSMFNDTWL